MSRGFIEFLLYECYTASLTITWSKEFDIRPHRCHTWTVQTYSPGGANVHPIYRKPKNSCHGNVTWVQGIGNICILSTTTQTPSKTNCLVAVVHTKLVNSNFSPKIGCHGNVRERWTPGHLTSTAHLSPQSKRHLY